MTPEQNKRTSGRMCGYYPPSTVTQFESNSRCPWCRGRGSFRKSGCTKCRGTGKVNQGKEPVDDPLYWKRRVEKCGGELHRAIFNGSIDQFSPLQQRHRAELLRVIRPDDSVFDAGCGYGRLLDLMPDDWQGEYMGVDISEEMVKIGRVLHPRHRLTVMDLRDLSCLPSGSFDKAVCCSVRSMVIRNLGQEEWDTMESEIRRVSRSDIIYLTFGEWD